nr:hypothetical protein [Tanacetum cinerariifolium]
MDIFAFIHTSDPTKVKVVERERKEDELRLLETTVSHTVPLLPVAPDRGESELDANVDKLLDEGGSGAQAEQGDSASGEGEQGMNIQPVTKTTDDVAEDVIPLQPRHLKKRKILVSDAGGPSHPLKKLRKDHETPRGTSVEGKSMSAVQRLFARALQNAEVRGEPIPTMPFITSSVSAMSERKGEGHTDSITRRNLLTISALQRPFAPIIIAATTITSTADPAVVVKEKIVKPSLFAAESTSADGTDPVMAGLTVLTGSDFLVGGIRTVINPDSNLQKTYVPQWNVTNGSRLDDGGVCHEMVNEFALPKFFASVRGMKHDQIFTEFNVGVAPQMSLSAEVRMHAEYNIREKMRLKSVVKKKNQFLKARDEEIKNLKARLLLNEAEATKAIRLHTKVSKLETLEKSLRDEVNALNERNSILKKERNALDVKVTNLEAIVDAQLKVVNYKFDNLYVDFVEMTLHLEEKFYLHLLTTIIGRRWILTHGMELSVVKCLNSPEYLSALGIAVSKAIEKGTQDGLAVGITLDREGRALTDVAAHNPSADIEAVKNILRLEEHLAERLGLNESQPHIDQLMVPIHHSPDKTVVGAFTLSLALDVFDARVWRIRENIMSHRSLFQDIYIPLAKILSAAALTGMEGTSNVVHATADITTTLFVTLASAGTVTPLFVDDYGVMGMNDQLAIDEDANHFPNVDDAELNIP